MVIKKISSLLAAVMAVIIVFSGAGADSTRIIPGFTPDVMAPLIIPGRVVNDQGESYTYTWALFQEHLAAAKSIGVKAVSADVWWGLVEARGDQQFDWSYYDQLFQFIIDAGLKIHPIMSFHSSGGNVGDTYNCPLPSWIWAVAGAGAKYVNELGNPGNEEYVALWAENTEAVHEQYQEYMDAFESHFANYADNIQEIDISCGPCGEWRYPSYDVYTIDGLSYGRGYPTRGYLYCYSEQAKESFRQAMQAKYSTISALNQAWGTNLQDFPEVSPPTNGDGFFNIKDSQSYINAQYGRDFINWYHGEMFQHGKAMLTLATKAFDDAFKGVPLGIKIPGVHWTAGGYDQANNYANEMPRSAEVCAGVVSAEFVPDIADQGCGPGYRQNMQMIAGLEQSTGADINAYYTCIDMPNNDVAPAYSMASALVFGAGKQAGIYNLTIKGENALAPNDGSSWTYEHFWWNINNVLSYSDYSGVNILRIFNIVNDTQKSNYQRLIGDHVRTSGTPKPVDQ